jgi:hypothetical protein
MALRVRNTSFSGMGNADNKQTLASHGLPLIQIVFRCQPGARRIVLRLRQERLGTLRLMPSIDEKRKI